MQPLEGTHYLYANVVSWKYAYDHPCPNETSDRSTLSLHLTAVTEHSSFSQDALPLGICLICNDEVADDELLSFWQLDLIPGSGEPPIPRCLETVLTLEELKLKDLKECLFIAANSSGCSVQVKLALQEKKVSKPADVAERSFMIVEFGYALNCQMSEIWESN